MADFLKGLVLVTTGKGESQRKPAPRWLYQDINDRAEPLTVAKQCNNFK